MFSVRSKIFFLAVVILCFFLMFAETGVTQEANQYAQPPEVTTEKKFPVPSIADLTPLVSEMSGRKAVLEQEMPDSSNLTDIEKSFSVIAIRKTLFAERICLTVPII